MFAPIKIINSFKLFVPRDHTLFELFDHDAQNLIKASEQLKLLLDSEDPEECDDITRRIKEHETIGDEITGKTHDQLNKSFLTPFDREDIHELVSNIDNVLDSIYGISNRIRLFKPKKLIPACKDLADVICLASNEIGTCIKYLRDTENNKEVIIQACGNLTDLEHRADELYYSGISDLMKEEKDFTELIKNKEILEIFEKCVDEAEDVSDTIKTILIKKA